MGFLCGVCFWWFKKKMWCYSMVCMVDGFLLFIYWKWFLNFIIEENFNCEFMISLYNIKY